MKKSIALRISSALLVVSSALLPVVHAADAKDMSENIEVTPQEGITQEELAAIRVLHEICPKLVAQDKAAFESGYSRLVKDYMPNESNPDEALEKLSKQKNFQKFLKEARADAKKAGDEQNRAVCEDVKAYRS